MKYFVVIFFGLFLTFSGVSNAAPGGCLASSASNLLDTTIDPARQLHNLWNEHFEKNSKNATYLMTCCGTGTIDVENALLDYPDHLRKKIFVLGIAYPGYMYEEACADAFHYRIGMFKKGQKKKATFFGPCCIIASTG